MITKDILLYESGSGGEIAVIGNDIALVEQIFQQCYLALFGGNIEASTLGNEPVTQIREDYWQNALFYNNDPGRQFNSQTERALNENALTSTGRVNIQRAVEADLQYFKTIADISVNVVILSVNKVQITIGIKQPGSQSGQSLQVIWDNAKQEMITDITI